MEFRGILLQELASSLGCTEPVAIALCVADCRTLMEARGAVGVEEVSDIAVYLSGNIIKNAHAVVVPNSGGIRGIQAAVALGFCAGRGDLGLEVLRDVKPSDIEVARGLMASGLIRCEREMTMDAHAVYIRTEIETRDGKTFGSVIEGAHDHVARRLVDGVWTDVEEAAGLGANVKSAESVDELERYSFSAIMDFVETHDLPGDSELRAALDRQVEQNWAIAEAGMKEPWGAEIGRSIRTMWEPVWASSGGDEGSGLWKIPAYTAAASDARMAGAPYPVVINSGSGNQGVTVSVPLIVYAKEMGIALTEERFYRALILSNLIGIYIKSRMDKLSAFCGAVSAAAAAGAGLGYLKGFARPQIAEVLSQVLLDVGGCWCDGATSSCAAKIVSGIQSALLALTVVEGKHGFQAGEGLRDEDVDRTIENVGRVAREGMGQTDEMILEILEEPRERGRAEAY